MVQPGEDISKYVKIEILIGSHSARNGGTSDTSSEHFSELPVWESDEDRGTTTDYALGPKLVVTRQDFQPLYDIFPEAVVQAVVESCDSENVGEMIAPDPSRTPKACYSFAGAVGRDLVAPSRGDVKADNPEDDQRSRIGAHLRSSTKEGRWMGANNLQELNLSTLRFYRSNARYRNRVRMLNYDSMFAVNPAVENPYDAFAINSLDALVGAPDPSRSPAGMKSSQASQQGALQGEIKGLEETSRNYVESDARYPSEFFEFQREFRKYLKDCYHDANILGCTTIYRLVEDADKRGDKALKNAFSAFEDDINKFGDEKRYLFGPTGAKRQPLAGAARLRFFAALHEIKENWKSYKQLEEMLLEEARKQHRSEDFEDDWKKFSAELSNFHQSFLHASFPDLIEDTLSKRADCIRSYIARAANDEDASEKLTRVRNELNALTKIPVGPAFDMKYILPHLPKSQPTVPSASGTSDSRKRRQVYLLPPDAPVAARGGK